MASSFLRVPLFVTAAALGLAAGGCNLEHTGGSPAQQPMAPNPPATAAPPVQVYGCGLPRGTGDGLNCGFEGNDVRFEAQVRTAIQKTMSQHPEWFADEHALEVGRYVDETVENLRRMGFCAFNDGEEIAIKNSNAFSDQYDIITGQGYILRGYTATCYPAWNAIPPAGDGS